MYGLNFRVGYRIKSVKLLQFFVIRVIGSQGSTVGIVTGYGSMTEGLEFESQ
jgi:hypothetical protein